MTALVRKNAIYMLAGQVVHVGLPLLAIPFLARTIGVDGLGVLAFVMSIGQLGVIFVEYGFNLSGPRDVATIGSSRHKVSEIFWSILFCKLTLFTILVLLICFLGLVFSSVRLNFQNISVVSLLVLANIIYPQWLFQGLQRMGYVSILQIVGKLAAFLGLLLFVRNEGDVLVAILFQSLSPLIGAVRCLPLVFAEVDVAGLKGVSMHKIRRQFSNGRDIFVSTAAISAYTTANTFILGIVASPAVVANYHIAEKIVRGLQAIYGPISNAVYPHVAGLVKVDPAGAVTYLKRIAFLLLSVSMFFAGAVYFAADWIMLNVFGRGYDDAGEILKLFIFVFPVSVAANILCIQTLTAFGYERWVSRILFAVAVFGIPLFVFLVYLFQGVGGAVANLIVEIIVLLLSAYIVKRRIG